MATMKDLTGMKFGRLTVIGPTNKRGNDRSVIWMCRCDCGREVFRSSNRLQRKDRRVKSCGCYMKEKGKDFIKIAFKSSPSFSEYASEYYILESRMRKDNTSGIKGVGWDDHRKKWRARIQYHGYNYDLLHSESKDECIDIRKEAEDAVRNKTFEQWIINYMSNKTTI